MNCSIFKKPGFFVRISVSSTDIIGWAARFFTSAMFVMFEQVRETAFNGLSCSANSLLLKI